MEAQARDTNLVRITTLPTFGGGHRFAAVSKPLANLEPVAAIGDGTLETRLRRGE